MSFDIGTINSKGYRISVQQRINESKKKLGLISKLEYAMIF